jgi:hypothetical protein
MTHQSRRLEAQKAGTIGKSLAFEQVGVWHGSLTDRLEDLAGLARVAHLSSVHFDLARTKEPSLGANGTLFLSESNSLAVLLGTY